MRRKQSTWSDTSRRRKKWTGREQAVYMVVTRVSKRNKKKKTR
jgi:hypothetical protein